MREAESLAETQNPAELGSDESHLRRATARSIDSFDLFVYLLISACTASLREISSSRTTHRLPARRRPSLTDIAEIPRHASAHACVR